eukprot:COSAG02_NODE_302_length_25234_cov_43.365307_2_plen_57_part_00
MYQYARRPRAHAYAYATVVFAKDKSYRGDKDKKWTFLRGMDYSSTRRLLILRPVSF